MTGVNVIARNVANPFLDAVSAISSDYTDDYRQRSWSASTRCAASPPAPSTPSTWTGSWKAASAPRRAALPGPEEFYNGPAEGNESTNDPPLELEPVSVAAGQTRSGIDIVFNRFQPNETLPLLDDSAYELALPFTFHMCGTAYDEVIVNANGTVSFGAPNPGFAESGPAFLAGPPQIAGAWDDFNPLAGGRVFFTESPSHFTVIFEGVPERTGAFTGIGSNTFSITLKRQLSEIDVQYGALTCSTVSPG